MTRLPAGTASAVRKLRASVAKATALLLRATVCRLFGHRFELLDRVRFQDGGGYTLSVCTCCLLCREIV